MVFDVGSRQVTSIAPSLYKKDILVFLIVDDVDHHRHRSVNASKECRNFDITDGGHKHSSCLWSLTEKNGKRAIFFSSSLSFCLYATKVFPLLVKAKYPPSATLHKERLALEWLTMGCLPRWMDWSRERHYRGIRQINVACAMLFPTRRSDISIALG